jgi:CheY-like chemotaxis protein
VSSEIGKGSTFSFTTKLQRINHESRQIPKVAAGLKDKTVLMVDDVASSRYVLAKHLNNVGLHAVAADSASQALHSGQLTQAACALIDVNMPDIDGFDLVKQIRKSLTAQQLPIIMMGALSDQVSQDELVRLDAQGFVLKPIDTYELVTTLNRLDLGYSDESEQLEAAQAVPVQAGAKKVLLVEDTPINQTLQSILLNRLGYEVVLAGNGVEGVAAFEMGRFDLILMDIQMPELTGIEATQQIRELEQVRNMRRTPIIAVTANALKGDRERYFESGMDGYVSKPLSMDSLKTEIERVMKQGNVFLADC